MRLKNQEVFDHDDLLKRARQYDLQALAEIYDNLSPGLYAYAYRQTGSVALAEECVAETFRKLLEEFSKHKGPRRHLRAYLYRMAHNWITDQYRRRKLTTINIEDQPLAEAGQSPPQAVDEKLERERLRQALHQLTPAQRQVIVLKYLEGWSSPEIARALKRPLEAVKGLQHRGLKALRQALAEENQPEKEVA
jgi:RNA polymerase sigma-70 factor (ECF subfamily)